MDGGHLALAVSCLLVLIPTSTWAQDSSRITEIEARIRVLPNLFSEEEVKVAYLGLTGSVLGDEYRIPGEILDLEVKDAQGDIEFTKRRSGNITIVRFFFRTALKPEDEEDIAISYRSSNFTSKSGTLWSYSTIFLAGSLINSWVITLEIPGSVELHLPSGSGLLGLSRIRQETDRTICEWRASNQETMVVAMGYVPVERTAESRLLLYMGLAGIFAVIILAAYLARTFYPEKKELPKAVEIAVKILEDRERRIVRELAGGSNLTQAELVKATKLSKATVSRAVVELERRRVVIRERSGRVVRVKLQDWILET
jgi:uncharacterized membrane protein